MIKQWYAIEVQTKRSDGTFATWKVERYTAWSMNRLMAFYWNKPCVHSVTVNKGGLVK